MCQCVGLGVCVSVCGLRCLCVSVWAQLSVRLRVLVSVVVCTSAVGFVSIGGFVAVRTSESVGFCCSSYFCRWLCVYRRVRSCPLVLKHPWV